MNRYRIFIGEDEFGREEFDLCKFTKPSFWQIITGNDNDCWQIIRTFKTLNAVNKYTKNRGLRMTGFIVKWG